MAHLHGLAGQYGKNEAARRKWRMVMGAFTFCGYAMALFGFAAGFAWNRFGPMPALAVMLLVTGLVALAWRGMQPYFDAMAKERIKYLRGAQGEALVAWLLDDLQDEWHVFNGVKLEPGSDIDHIVVGPAGVYCISTKSHRGLFAGTPEGLRHNGQPSPFAQQALAQTMRLRARLEALMGRDVPWVQPVLAVPFGYTEGDACGGKVWLVHQDSLSERLDPANAPKRLNKPQVERTVKALDMLQSTAAAVYERPLPATP